MKPWSTAAAAAAAACMHSHALAHGVRVSEELDWQSD